MSTEKDTLKTPSLPSVPRALELLEQVAGSPKGLKLTQLTRILGYPRSTMHCLLLTLERSGYIQRSAPRGPYISGPRLLELSSKALVGSSLREAAMPQLRRLVQQTNLGTHVAMLERDQVIIIAQFAPPGIRLMTSPGQRLELHCTALGKAILAWLPDKQVSELMRGRALTPHNDRTIVSKKRFQEELAITRRRGYGIDDEEDAIGYRCLACPILDHAGVPLAAVSVMGSTTEISDENAAILVHYLSKAAARVAETLHTDKEYPEETFPRAENET